MTSNKNSCTFEYHQANSWWEHDARGIPLCRVCDKCQAEKLARYRPDVLTDSNYWADEEIDGED